MGQLSVELKKLYLSMLTNQAPHSDFSCYLGLVNNYEESEPATDGVGHLVGCEEARFTERIPVNIKGQDLTCKFTEPTYESDNCVVITNKDEIHFDMETVDWGVWAAVGSGYSTPHGWVLWDRKEGGTPLAYGTIRTSEGGLAPDVKKDNVIVIRRGGITIKIGKDAASSAKK